MSKKSRRTRARQQTAEKRPKSVAEKRIESHRSSDDSRVSVSSVAPLSSSAQEARYRYVLPELRRIGIIAGALFIVIIVLTFILG